MPEVYVDVILPLAVTGYFTYRVPQHMLGDVEIGRRVIVPFGRQKMYSAIIRGIKNTHPADIEIKDIQSVLDEVPVVNAKQFAMWEWMAAYYMCREGEVMNAALPATLKLQSETKVMSVRLPEDVKVELTEAEETILAALEEKQEMTLGEIEKLLNKKSVHSILKRAFEKNILALSEEINQRYKPKKIAYLRLAAAYQSENALEELFSELEQDNRKARQLETLMVFMKYLFDDPDRYSVKKNLLLNHEGISKSSVTSLLTNGILVEFDVITDRIPVPSSTVISPLALSEAQQKSLDEINASFEKHDATLFHGVTSSGKTEVYIHLIEKIIASGKQVLYLIPEIALTTQLIIRLQKYFGDKVGVYHSRYSGNERVEVWNHVLNFAPGENYTRSQIVLGARSALFLPFRNLGLIIVDEEHDHSFKQADPAPRYNARDSAIVLANIHQAKTLLGSATPAMESFFNAENGRYGLVTLTERHGGIRMPEILVADVKEARRKKIMKSHFTPELINAVRDALREKEQVILFQNRRGFSNYLECRNCNSIPHCKNCSVTLTYHKFANILKCHYCGYFENVPALCPVCGDYHLEVKGFGTEKIEEEIAVFFPEAMIARMDLDSTRTKSSFQKIISDFEERRIDILVGTQMVTKGLDFDNVSTVGIINADQLLNFPDFRSFEKSFQLMAQVSGRSGRKNKRGKVIIQTQQPHHWVINEVVHNNYKKFYQLDLLERSKFGYPPFSRMIELTLRHKENDYVQDAAQSIASMLRDKLGQRVLGPHIPLVSKIRNLFYRSILIKIERTHSASEVKKIINECINNFYADRAMHTVSITIDVDPV